MKIETQETAHGLDSILKNMRDHHGRTQLDIYWLDNNSVEKKFYEFLESKGYVNLTRGGGKIVLASITERGKNYLLEGGFVSQFERDEQIANDSALDRKSKKWSIINSKWSLVLSILALIISLLALFKENLF